MRTVIAIDHGPELSKLSGTRVDVDGGSKHRSSLQSSAVSLMKSLWTIVAEGAVEYCRIIYDVLPDDFMVNGLCALSPCLLDYLLGIIIVGSMSPWLRSPWANFCPTLNYLIS